MKKGLGLLTGTMLMAGVAMTGCDSGRGKSPTNPNGEPIEDATQLTSFSQGKGHENLGVGITNGSLLIDGIRGGTSQFARICIDTQENGAWGYDVDTPLVTNYALIGVNSRPTDAWLQATGLNGSKQGEVNNSFPAVSLERVGDNCPNIGQPLVLNGNVANGIEVVPVVMPTPKSEPAPAAGPACIPEAACSTFPMENDGVTCFEDHDKDITTDAILIAPLCS